MEEATQAFVFFWLAGLFLLCGSMVGFFSKVGWQRRFGAILAALGLLSLLATPWTLSFSPSSAFGHLLGSLIGPAVLLGVGFYQITFSGNVPVGRLTRTDRNVGVVMVVVGVLWLEAMHWWAITPTYPDTVNRYWLIFWPTMLLGTLAGACGAYAMVGLIGEERQREQQLMLLVAVFAGLLLLLGATNDGPNVAKSVFAEEVLLAAADIFGALVGAAVAVLLFAVVLAVYESQRPAPERLNPPNAAQLEQAGRTIAQNLRGGSEDECRFIRPLAGSPPRACGPTDGGRRHLGFHALWGLCRRSTGSVRKRPADGVHARFVRPSPHPRRVRRRAKTPDCPAFGHVSERRSRCWINGVFPVPRCTADGGQRVGAGSGAVEHRSVWDHDDCFSHGRRDCFWDAVLKSDERA